MVGEVTVGDSDTGRALNDIDEAISTVCHGNVVDPDILGAKDRNPVPIAAGPEPEMVN